VCPAPPVLRLRRTALTFGDRPVEYRVATIHIAQHNYVHLLSRPSGGP
jgi:GntR family transcriptional regulator